MVDNNKTKADGSSDAVEDAVGEMIGDIAGALGRLALFLLVWAVRLPVLSVPTIGIAVLWFQVGPRPAIAVALLTGVMLLAWGMLSPATLRASTVDPVVVRFRVWRRYRDWDGVCADCGLTRTRGDKLATPKLQTVRLGEVADVLVVRMLRGQSIGDYTKATDALAGAFDAEQVRIEQSSPQQLRIVVQRSQPLATPITPDASKPRQKRPDDATSGPAARRKAPGEEGIGCRESSNRVGSARGGAGESPAGASAGHATSVTISAITVGKTGSDGPWRLPLIGNHLLIGGVTGAGKGSVLWSIIGGLAPHIHTAHVRLLVADPKGGMELGPGQALFHRFAYRPEAIASMLADAVEIMTGRAERLRGVTRTHTPTVGEPQLVVMIDELAALTAFADRKLKTEIEHSLGLLLSQGRAVGVSVVAAVQDPSKEIVPLRQFFPLRLGLRMAEPTQTTMILGPGAVEAGTRCHQLPAHMPGVGFIATDQAASPVLVRAFHYQDEHIARLIRHFPPPRTRESDLADGDAPQSGSAGNQSAATKPKAPK
ncbi:S-DNA-T family DNA segregation ATPase FtsK/SpoIIIE [Tsukamurella ocularis]|uniref:FtsK/SpoIIIE domain-containing protein n=1 Tax=Tsukamurella ocularis TaxID=1970234 RepID=UPI00216A1A03|nr:FtsK/SpoIIIE domain-containing protein [Tsukamurella ocularis]MCS3790013.1 S-DNA-T family DNA segregation ATPase FtsK/SpoIIIE [Tsukamurella ocularis]